MSSHATLYRLSFSSGVAISAYDSQKNINQRTVTIDGPGIRILLFSSDCVQLRHLQSSENRSATIRSSIPRTVTGLVLSFLRTTPTRS